MTTKYSLPTTPIKNGASNKKGPLDLKLKVTPNAYCPNCRNAEERSVSDENDRGMVDNNNNFEDEESIDPALLVDKLSPLEKAILDKIREINVAKVIEESPKDIEIIRSKNLLF
jgi:hypothetical protein